LDVVNEEYKCNVPLVLVNDSVSKHRSPFQFSAHNAVTIKRFAINIYSPNFNKKILIHVHGGDYLEQNQPPKWAAFLLKLIFSGKKPKIVLSQFEKELVIKRYNAKNVHVVPNCIDLNEAIALERIKNYELPLKLIFIGRIDRNKGLDYIYQALSILKEEGNSSFRFIIAGSGPDKEEFVNKFTNLLGTSFEYKGVVSGQGKNRNCYKIAIFSFCHPCLKAYQSLYWKICHSAMFLLLPV
jgi:glycosyltransferase involved in cell wall biosynthesis